MSDEEIASMIQKYKNKIERDRINYHTKYKFDEKYKEKRSMNSKIHYEKTKDKRKEKYKSNSELAKAKSSYYYYKNNNKLDVFMVRYPERVQVLAHFGLKVESLLPLV